MGYVGHCSSKVFRDFVISSRLDSQAAVPTNLSSQSIIGSVLVVSQHISTMSRVADCPVCVTGGATCPGWIPLRVSVPRADHAGAASNITDTADNLGVEQRCEALLCCTCLTALTAPSELLPFVTSSESACVTNFFLLSTETNHDTGTTASPHCILFTRQLTMPACSLCPHKDRTQTCDRNCTEPWRNDISNFFPLARSFHTVLASSAAY